MPGRIRDLLDDLAKARDRLDLAIKDGALQRQLVAESCQILAETVQAVEQGRRIPKKEATRTQGKPAVRKGFERLTKREIEVLRLIAEGHSTKEIAHRLNITFKTAVSHRSNLLHKLGIHESATLVRLAVRAGLVAL